MPKSCHIAKFQLIEPTKEKLKKINLDNKISPACIHLAGTGKLSFLVDQNNLEI